jgi:tetratricopeptide (TPR) repeat protein
MSSGSSRICAACVLAVLALASATAGADPGSPDDDKRARELFRLGERHYAAGRYEKAAVLYDDAYRLSGRAELLLAIVNTYERMGDYEQAIDYLKQYLEHPRARNQDMLRERLRRLERADRERSEERRRIRDLEKADKERARELRRLRQQRRAGVDGGDEDDEAGPSRTPAYLLLAGGAVGLAGAIGFGVAASQAGQDAELQCADTGLCRSAADGALGRERTFSLMADVSAVVGLGSAAVGVYLLWKGREQPTEGRRALRIQPTFLPGGLGVAFAGQL